MPHRPVHSPIYDDFDSSIAMERPTTPRHIVANVGVWNFSKSALVHAHSPPKEHASFDQFTPARPRTSSGVFDRLRSHSFSRPRTSDGAKRAVKDPLPNQPSQLKHAHTSSDLNKIGVAIGSPTVAKHLPQRPKPKRWKTIGSLFNPKRQTERSTEASTSQKDNNPEQLAKSSSWPVRGASLHLRSRSRNFSKSWRAKPPLPPQAEDVQELKKLTRSAPASIHRNGSQRRPRKASAKPVIDVNIPRVEHFDRFSILFSGLLSDPLTSDEPPPPTPSLLERRNIAIEELPLSDPAVLRKESTKQRPSRPRAQTETNVTTLRHKPVGCSSLKRATSASHKVERAASLRSTRSTRSSRSNRSLGKSPTYSLFPKTVESTPPVPSASTFGGTPRPSTSSGRPNAPAFPTPKLSSSPAKNQTSWLQVDDTPIAPRRGPKDILPAEMQASTDTRDPTLSVVLNMYMREPSAQPLIFPPSPASSGKANTLDEIEAALPSPSLYSARSSGEPHGFHHTHFHTHSRSRSTNDLPSLHQGPAYEVYLTPPLRNGDFPAPLFATPSTPTTTNAPSAFGYDRADSRLNHSPALLSPAQFIASPPQSLTAHSLARVPSLNHSLYDYDAPHSPLIAVARTVSVCYKHDGGRAQPHLLVRAPGTRNLRGKAKDASADTDVVEEDQSLESRGDGRASFQESVVRVRSPCLVRVEDDSDESRRDGVEEMSQEERDWMRRRSVWGLLEGVA